MRLEDYVEVCIHFSFYLMTFNNHFSISYLRVTLSFCRWCLKHLLFGLADKRPAVIIFYVDCHHSNWVISIGFGQSDIF
jgi:hypothetical protein